MLRTVVPCLLLIGCAAAPTQHDGTTEPAVAWLGAAPPSQVDFLPLRIGVEYLPPSETAAELGSMLSASRGEDPEPGRDAVRVRALVAPGRSDRTADATEGSREMSPWLIDAEEIEEIDDPFQRYTMQFVDDLIGEDEREVKRELRIPIFTNRLRWSMSEAHRAPIDEQDEEQETRFLNDVGLRLFRRPLRNLAKQLAFVDELELAVEEFKAGNVPTSDEYQEKNDSVDWGRISMRVSLSDSSDPAEFSYYNWGWRVGSSQEHGKLHYRFRLTDRIDGGVRYQFDYDTHDTGIRADLRWIIDQRTQLNVLLGDRIDFLSGPTEYMFQRSPLDGTAGILFHVEHFF